MKPGTNIKITALVMFAVLFVGWFSQLFLFRLHSATQTSPFYAQKTNLIFDLFNKHFFFHFQSLHTQNIPHSITRDFHVGFEFFISNISYSTLTSAQLVCFFVLPKQPSLSLSVEFANNGRIYKNVRFFTLKLIHFRRKIV